MEFLRQVRERWILILGVFLLAMTPSCTRNDLTPQEAAIQELQQSQECCYLEYGVKESVEGYAHKISRNAAVMVHVQQSAGRYRGTGTYFKYKGHHIVITAAHIWVENPPKMLSDAALIASPEEKVIGQVVYFDPYTDIAILKIPALESRKPAKLVRDPQYSVGETVVYSGFPGQNSLLTFEGELRWCS